MLKSHPNKSLKDHLENTYIIGDKILKNKHINFTIMDNDKLNNINRVCLLMHDSGKAMSYFQAYINDIEKGLNVEHYDDMKDHGLISGILAYYIAYKLYKDELFAYIVLFIISHHHGNLSNVTDFCSKFRNVEVLDKLEKQYDNIDKIELDNIYLYFNLNTNFNNTPWMEICNCISHLKNLRFLKKLKEFKIYENYLIINLLFSILIYSDKIEAIYHSVKEDINDFIEDMFNNYCFNLSIVENYKVKKFGKKTEPLSLREMAYINVSDNIKNVDLNNKIFSINLPTGSGKTLAVLNAAIILQNRIKNEKGYVSKIVYVLPFTSIIEQNYDVFCKVLGTDKEQTVMKHHYLADRQYIKESGSVYEYGIGEHLIESWDSRLIVSTFVQLLHSIFTNRNRQLKKFHNIVNSIIVLDEVQSIPFKYWELVKETFKLMSKYLGCYFILMTATMPLIFSEEGGEIIELASEKYSFFNSFNRIKLNCEMLDSPINLDIFKQIIEEDIKNSSGKSYLIVLNTIKSSIEIWKHLHKKFKNNYEIFYLSSNIIPKEKQKRIEEIKEYKGKKIVISTQVIEAGVDIDLDIVYRDFGPFDSINQTAGRCNREGEKEIGIVKIVSLVDDNNKEKPYSSYVYDTLLLERSKETLEGIDEIEEKKVIELSQKYFKELKKYGDDREGRELIDMISNLCYKDAFEYTEDTDKNKKVFSLIEQKFKAVEVFIETDEEAAKLWDKYQEIRKVKNRFERKRRFSEIKKEFLQYVISIPEEAVKKHFNIEDEYIINVSKNMIENTYDEQTGFMRGELEDYSM